MTEPWTARNRRRGKRQQRHDSALAVIVCTQDERYILERDDHRQRPEDQRDNADHIAGIQLQPVGGIEDRLQGVQRTGADVAINHAKGSQREAIYGRPVRLGLAGVLSAGCSECISSHVSYRWPPPGAFRPGVRIARLLVLVRFRSRLNCQAKAVCYLWLMQV